MAKKSTAKSSVPAVVEPKKKSHALVTAGASAPPAALAKKMSKDSGKGVSTAAEDNLVPLIYILQPLSPQVNKKKEEFIEGAAPGMIWLRNHSEPLVDGDEGILVQPCFFSKDWVEWVPRKKGGGLVGKHDSLPADVKEVADEENPSRKKFVRKNGNEMQETRYHVVRVFTKSGVFPYVIPFKSTGHTVSRQWQFMMNSVQLPDGSGKAASWAKLYRLTTKEKTNPSGTWSLFEVEPAGWVPSEEEYDAGKALFDAFAKGEKAIEQETDVGGDADSDDGAM